MSNVIKCDKITSVLKRTILQYCPYTDDRLYLLGNSYQPNFDIKIKNCASDGSGKSQIFFLHGNTNHKKNVDDTLLLDSYLGFDELKETIDFILSDHEVICGFSIDDNKVILIFGINWTDDSTKGLNCGNIGLTVEFENMEELKRYLSSLVNSYYDHLDKCRSFSDYKSKYIKILREHFFSECTRENMFEFLAHFSDQELVDLLKGINDDTFMKIYTKGNGDDKNSNLRLVKKDF